MHSKNFKCIVRLAVWHSIWCERKALLTDWLTSQSNRVIDIKGLFCWIFLGPWLPAKVQKPTKRVCCGRVLLEKAFFFAYTVLGNPIQQSRVAKFRSAQFNSRRGVVNCTHPRE